MTVVADLAEFVARASWNHLSRAAQGALKIRVLDSLGCAFGALDSELAKSVRGLTDELGGRADCTLVGGGRSAPDRAAFFNGTLVRYLDFNDSYLAKRETCHPSDNLGAVLAASEFAGASGRSFMTALAVAYQVQCRLSDEAPVRDRGFDHTTQGACAAAAGVAHALGLDAARTAHALAIAVTTSPALRVTRTGALSHWKGLAAPHAAFVATNAALLASRGVTGPLEAFEGNKGFFDSVSGPFSIDWRAENLERVLDTSLKRYNAEAHAQSTIEGTLELFAEQRLAAYDIEKIEIDIFDVAYRIIGGGEEGDKTRVRTKEQADHSLPYMVAAAAIDGRLMPEQYAPERIVRDDVQRLLRRIVVRPDPELSLRFPAENACRIRIRLTDGRVVATEKSDHLGSSRRPFSFDQARAKFDELASAVAPERRARIVDRIAHLEDLSAAEFAEEVSLYRLIS